MRNPTIPSIQRITWCFILSLCPILVFIALIFHYGFGLVDDAYIPMVYARNIIRGFGIVFIPGGEHVEGFTSPLWTAGLTLGELFHLPLPTLAFIGSVCCGILLIILTIRMVSFLFPSGNQGWEYTILLPSFAGILLAADYSFAGWSASGLETSAYALTQMLLAYSLLKQIHPRISVLLLLLLALLRPEGILFFIPILLIWYWQQRPLKPILINLFLWVAIPYVMFLISRYLYFGYWLPNTYYAKLGMSGWPLLWRGCFYVYTFFIPRPIFLLIFFIVFLDKNWKQSSTVPLLIFALMNIGIVILEGGDHFAMHRFLVPMLPFLVLLTTRGCKLVRNHIFESRKTISHPKQTWIFAFVLLILVYGQHSRIFLYKNDDHYIFSKGVQWLANETAWAQGWKRYGLWLKEKYPPGTLIAVTTAGAVCYFSELPSVDILGLNDTTVAHAPNPHPDWRYPGHDKSDPDYILSQKPKFIQLFPLLFFSSHPYPEWRLEQMITYPAQRDLWNHPEFKDKYQLQTEKTKYGYISYYERK